MRTPAAAFAAVLSGFYALAFAALSVAVFILRVSHEGSPGTQVDALANRGVATAITYSMALAVVLALGAVGVWRGARGLPIIVALGLAILIGLVLEVVDIASGFSLVGNIIGAASLVLAAIPIVLLSRRRGQKGSDTSA